MRTRRLPEDEVLMRLYTEDGENMTAIAARYGVSCERVRQRLARCGITARSHREMNRESADAASWERAETVREEIEARLRACETPGAIGLALGIPSRVIFAILRAISEERGPRWRTLDEREKKYQAVLDAVKNGATVNDACREHHVAIATYTQLAREQGRLPRRSSICRTRVQTQERRERILADVAAGRLTYDEIAVRHGVVPSLVSNFAVAAGYRRKSLSGLLSAHER